MFPSNSALPGEYIPSASNDSRKSGSLGGFAAAVTQNFTLGFNRTMKTTGGDSPQFRVSTLLFKIKSLFNSRTIA